MTSSSQLQQIHAEAVVFSSYSLLMPSQLLFIGKFGRLRSPRFCDKTDVVCYTRIGIMSMPELCIVSLVLYFVNMKPVGRPEARWASTKPDVPA